MRRRDGTSLFAEAAFTRVEENGEVTIVTAIRDVSERERQAAELTRAKELAEEAQAKAERELVEDRVPGLDEPRDSARP